MHITRREALQLLAIGGGTLLSPLGTRSAFADTSPQNGKFQQPLRLPNLLKPVHSNSKYDYYEIVMQQQDLQILPQLGKTRCWTYGSTLPGPMIRQPKRRESVVRFINQLGQDSGGKDITTSIHLHGMASRPEYDGYSEDLIPLNYYKDYYYPNNRGATLWYHDHAVHQTSRNVYMGLAGMYVVEYSQDDFVNPADSDRLPQGDYEIPLIIQDKQFALNGSLIFDDRGQRGVYGDIVLINGVPYPYLEVERRKYRFRILNGSASRTYELALSQDPQTLTIGDKLTVIATDAGLLATPVELKTPASGLQIGIAERYEIVIDFAAYPDSIEHLYLRNMGFPSNLDSEPQALLRFDLKQRVKDDSIIPTQLGKVLPIQNQIPGNAKRRTFRFERNGGQWKINNKTWDPQRVDANPGQGDYEIWTFVNTGGWVHPVHVHLVDFQILDRNGQAPPAYQRGWKDVVLVHELETVRIAARFGPLEGKYMMHCHNIVHEDHDMMTQFQVGKGGCEPTCAKPQPLPAPKFT